jgi:hypothetical protein
MQQKSVCRVTLQLAKSRFVLDEFANWLIIDTTELAAIAAWEILQGFYELLPQLDSEVESKEFNLWTGNNHPNTAQPRHMISNTS